MIPFQEEAFVRIELDKIEKNIGTDYKNLLAKQERGLITQSEVITKKATIIYRSRYNENNFKYKMLQKNACDFI